MTKKSKIFKTTKSQKVYKREITKEKPAKRKAEAPLNANSKRIKIRKSNRASSSGQSSTVQSSSGSGPSGTLKIQ